MRHQRQRYQLSRSASHRKALLMNLSKEVIEHERIQTTEAKAKAVKPEVEKLITLAKRGDLHARRQVLTVVTDKGVVHTLFTEIGPQFAERDGGYTRITKIGPRKGDNAPLAVIELIQEEAEAKPSRRRRARRAQPAGRPAARAEAAAEDAAEAAEVAAEAAEEAAEAAQDAAEAAEAADAAALDEDVEADDDAAVDEDADADDEADAEAADDKPAKQ